MKLIYKILIAVGVLLAVYLGGFIHGRSSVEKYPTEYTRQLGIELNSSSEANRRLQETNTRLESTNNQLRGEVTESSRILDGIGYAVEELEKGIEESGNIIEECIKFVNKLREIDSETTEN